MKYGWTKELTDWKFWLRSVATSIIIVCLVDYLFFRLLETEVSSWKEFLLMFLLGVVSEIMGKLLVCSWVGDYWLFEDDNTLQKVKREVEKNKELYRRIKAVYKDINYYDSDFEKLYPPARKELVEYKKKHKLKRYEKDYVNWVIKDCDRAFKKKLWNY